MIQWLNPWAWAGLGALVIPIVVHLFSRRPPRVVEFPTLRFLEASALRPTRRSSVSDLPLLAVRMALLAVAVAALAQPLWVDRATNTSSSSSAGKNGSRNTAAATASVIERRTPGNSAYGGAADHIAATGDSLVLFAESDELRTAITRAAAWLETQAAPRALVVRSSFPFSALDSSDIVALPRDLRLTLVHEVPSPSAGPGLIELRAPRDTVQWITALSAQLAEDVVAAVHALGGAVVLRLPTTTTLVSGDSTLQHPLLVGTANDQQRLRRRAIRPSDDAPAIARLLAVADDQAVRDMTARLQTDTSIHSALTDSTNVPLHFDAAGFPALIGVVHDDMPVVISQIPEHPALATAVLLALSDNPAIRGLRAGAGIDRDFRSAAVVQQWQQLPSGPPIGIGAQADRHSTPTWARWGWMLVLVLAVVEWIMRRRS
ncbi:MAG TPA: hypothetical protein DGD08_06410 [Gemmatimonas aurantiaca]|uniref:Aerotolerance regulator N-terminal domain-containing protein n=2 Tax=Gemmatimonas aurantiaca TaxID=173480 RepID=A0A3D4V6U3_9BACT|nr:BatA domain-containing protein [Gemmatimonas aurantiaca]BAH38056.1 hypothetical membrane protein [Gemmatimonas aurantiaca T-27]HCT56830.1 hypothetical protein [Gemmatimonas aurantiaca]